MKRLERIGLSTFMDLEARIPNSTLEWSGREPSNRQVVGLREKHRY